jgi:DNA-binding CsgD family transcriptional regulator
VKKRLFIIPELSDLEFHILLALAQGRTKKEIVHELGIVPQQFYVTVYRIKEKLNSPNLHKIIDALVKRAT